MNKLLSYLFVLALFGAGLSSCTKDSYCPHDSDEHSDQGTTRAVVTESDEVHTGMESISFSTGSPRNDIPNPDGGGITDDDDNESGDDERTSRSRRSR